jgi:ribosomal protein S12 methylthiotransferase
MLGIMANAGFRLTSEEKEADIIIINTCAFIRPAVEEAIETILSLARNKERGSCRYLIVTGCLAQRYGKELVRLLPEVDAFIGTDGVQEVNRVLQRLAAPRSGPLFLVRRPRFIMDAHTPRRRTTPFYTAYLKIAEGCTHHCSFCTIPRIRGRLRSRSIHSIYVEALRLAGEGVRELVLVAQDAASYGDDLGNDIRLAVLVRRLLEIPGLDWIRLLYLYPTRIDKELLELMASEPRICPYLDVPVQHISMRMLGLMRRRYGRDDIYRLIGEIRQVLPEAVLRTSIIVGFPGETEAEFNELLRFLEDVCFEHVGVFPYANEEGTAASALPGQLPEKVKRQRQKTLMKCQQTISLTVNRSRVGRIIPVLIEGLSDETEYLLKGRTAFQAPDIDGQVYITAGQTQIGQIVPVRISKAYPYDLIGEIV